jgi:hypothetical protein
VAITVPEKHSQSFLGVPNVVNKTQI